VLTAAVETRASDVHFEPTGNGLEVRFRLDGVLQEVASAPVERAAPLVARLKVLAGLATYRTDTPQDGRIPGNGFSSNADLRLSTYPTVRGEKAVVRLFTARAEDFRLASLGLGDEVTSEFQKALRSREGLLVLTGPAGSGKTTTLYAAIQHVRDDGHNRRHVVTIEDPAECLLPGITQTQTNPPAGLTFANCLRSILRQDPEVIMVGEARDSETASLAVEAALTGHLVLTTLHAGTAAGVYARLLEIGIEPHLVASVVRASIAQRLVRRFCPQCRTQGTEGWAPTGCDKCLQTGYRGRIPLAEILTPSPELRKVVLARPDLDEIERAARASGMRPLSSRASELVRAGDTSQLEVDRVLAGSWSEGS
jgi:type II secretory ATPase GspE/PulE/Tfp pilus assembly ATPase PilB-like protein